MGQKGGPETDTGKTSTDTNERSRFPGRDLLKSLQTALGGHFPPPDGKPTPHQDLRGLIVGMQGGRENERAEVASARVLALGGYRPFTKWYSLRYS